MSVNGCPRTISPPLQKFVPLLLVYELVGRVLKYMVVFLIFINSARASGVNGRVKDGNYQMEWCLGFILASQKIMQIILRKNKENTQKTQM